MRLASAPHRGPLLLAAAASALLSAPARADVNVASSGFSWLPADVVVAVGEPVHWSWTGTHNVAEVDGPADIVWNGTGFRSGSPVAGGSFDLVFAEPGFHHYVCEPHAGLGMRGTVTVVPAGTLHDVVNAGASWTPADLEIDAGDTVRWRWTGTHNVAEVDGPTDMAWNGTGFYSGPAVGGGFFFHAFAEAGAHWYVCEPHAGLGMRGTVSVLPGCPDPSLPAPDLAIAYDSGTQTVMLSWDPVTETVGGCPVAPQYRVLAGVDPQALIEVAVVAGTSWSGAVDGDRRFYAVAAVTE